MPRRAAANNVVKLTKGMLATLALAPGQGERIVWDAELRGFGIRLRASGNRTWVIRPPRSGGASKLHTLGSADTIDLASARRSAQEKIAEAALGGDPTKAKREARAQAALTFGSLVDRYIADKEAKGRRPSTVSNMRHHLKCHWQPLHCRPLNAISRADLAVRHRELVSECGPHAADRARSILSTFFVWAMAEGMANANPVTNTRTATVPTRRDRVLSDEELVAIWCACREDDFGRIVRLLILTGQRRDEVAEMRHTEIDLPTALWRLPPERTKNHRPHEIPLSAPALSIVSAASKRTGRDFLFGEGEGPFSGFSKSKARLDERIRTVREKDLEAPHTLVSWRLHDLRRTVATRMADLGVLPHVVEAVLNHVSGHKAGVAGIYNRSSYRAEKQAALTLWAMHIEQLVKTKQEA
ncbi:integrase [Methylobacterium sp. BE186]|uniref:tyrosine-type recombinase/integrase n=1 Tax=Methylobacterium sp. BE186 TaxID=2817715 RepID=UPI00285CA124|nr:tyrosine-type recombinase/integrase [Methylobacterium sp. BE186]MDR7037981.1 integrase [Methylobacterium sp. BE186]